MEASLRAQVPTSAPSSLDVAPSQLAFVADRELMSKVVIRDEEAFRTLVGRHGPTALGLAMRILRQPALAQEATQDAFLAVWQGASAYDPARGSVRTWLMGIVHHRAVDGTRREQTQRNVAMAVGAPVPEADFAQDVAVSVDLPGERATVRAALRRLPEPQRRVIELMYLDGQSQSQISASLEVPLGTVKTRCRHAMRQLQAELIPPNPMDATAGA